MPQNLFAVVLIYMEKTSYLCTGLYCLGSYLSQSDEFSHDIRRGSLRRAEYGGVTI